MEELKILALQYIGTGNGKHWFRDPTKPLCLISGTEEQYRHWQIIQRRYRIIDSDVANAALKLRELADKIEPGFDARAWLEARGL